MLKRLSFFAVAFLCVLCLSLPALAAETYSNFEFGLRGGALAFTAKTTLPEGASVGVWIHQIRPKAKALYSAVPLDYPKNMDLTVQDRQIMGIFRSTKEYGLPAGPYELVFTSPATAKDGRQQRYRITVKDAVKAQGWQEPEKGWK